MQIEHAGFGIFFAGQCSYMYVAAIFMASTPITNLEILVPCFSLNARERVIQPAEHKDHDTYTFSTSERTLERTTQSHDIWMVDDLYRMKEDGASKHLLCKCGGGQIKVT